MKNRTLQLLQRLQTKWQLTNPWQVVAVLATFSLAGSTVVLIRPWFFQYLGFDEHTFWLWKAAAYVFFVFPTYQVLLLIYGGLLGQHYFFAHKTKKIGLRLSGIVSARKLKN